MSQQLKPTNYGALSTLTTVFFFWGFIAAGNSVFIPFCKNYFHLDQFQSQLIDFAFYLAYFVGALFLFVAGSIKNQDLVGTWGYKKSIVYGLGFSALGAAIMIISVYMNVFGGMLMGLFVVALGFSLQQTSANPFMISLGDESTGSNRISLGGGINSLGTSIGPLIVALSLFGKASAIKDEDIAALSLNKVIILYAAVGLLFILIAAMFGVSKKVPSGIFEDKPEKAKKAMNSLLAMTALLVVCFIPVFSSYKSQEAYEIVKLESKQGEIKKSISGLQPTLTEKELNAKLSQNSEYSTLNQSIKALKQPLEKTRLNWLLLGLVVVVGGLLFAFVSSKKSPQGWGAMQYPQLSLGMLAIFVYVGVEVAIGSNLGELLKKESFGGFTSSEIAPFIAMYWGSLMIGRWTGAVSALNLSEMAKKWLRTFMPLIAFGVVMFFTWMAGYNIVPLKWYFLCVLVQMLAFYFSNDKPAFTLMVFGILGTLATIVGLMNTGNIGIYAFLSAGLFLSIMWPCIFSLSVAGLGKYQSQGAGFLVMMILGGAILPPIQGKLADIIGIHESFFIATIAFLYLTYFAYFVKKSLQKQGIEFDQKIEGGH